MTTSKTLAASYNLTARAEYLNFGADGQMRALAIDINEPTVQVIDAVTGEPVAESLDADFTGDERLDVLLSPDNRTLATVAQLSNYDEVQLWEVATGEPVGPPLDLGGRTAETQSRLIVWVAFSPDGSTLGVHALTNRNDDSMSLWDAATGEPLGDSFDLSFSDSVVPYIAAVQDSGIVAADCEEMVQLWDAATGQRVGSPLEGHSDYVLAMEFSPDGRTLATASADGTVRLWDVTATDSLLSRR